MAKTTLRELVDAFDSESMAEEELLWGAVDDVTKLHTSLVNSPKFQEVVMLLQAEPILVPPVLKWLRHKIGEMSMAKLRALYTEEEIEALYKEMK